jgi:hypothetical protein
LLLLAAGEQSCATVRTRQIAGGLMMATGSLGIIGGLYASTPCDPAEGADCRHAGAISESSAPVWIGGGLVLALLGAVVYFASTGHASSTLASPAPPPPAPPAPPPSPPIEPLPKDQRL